MEQFPVNTEAPASIIPVANQHVPLLTPAQVEKFYMNGFLVLTNFFSAEKVHQLRSEIASVIDGLDPNGAPIFTTNEQERKVAGAYFLASGDKIAPFMEEKSNLRASDGTEVPFALRINKIGHALHDLNPVFQEVSYDPKVGRIARDLGLEKPLAVQSMYIFKQPNIGGEVGMHQDGSFLYTEPQTCLGYWWALDDCHKQNGCLYAIPGSHKAGVRRHFRRQNPPEVGTEFFPAQADLWEREEEVALECPAGTLVLIHNALVHYSAENTSAAARHAYSIHTVDGREGVTYPAINWLQKSDGSAFGAIPFE
jgi:phytanoyl-CoA hydroxylase